MTNYEVKITRRHAGPTKEDFCESITRTFTPSPASILKEYNVTESCCYRNYRTRKEKHYRQYIDKNTILFIRIRPSKH